MCPYKIQNPRQKKGYRGREVVDDQVQERINLYTVKGSLEARLRGRGQGKGEEGQGGKGGEGGNLRDVEGGLRKREGGRVWEGMKKV